MCVLSILFQEVVEEPTTDGDSDHTDSEGSMVDSMEACEGNNYISCSIDSYELPPAPSLCVT
jgi:hypothetical protein